MYISVLLVCIMSMFHCTASFARSHFLRPAAGLLAGSRTAVSSALGTHDASIPTAGSAAFRPILVSIEGNIGAGKTTLLKRLRDAHPEWISIDEPVDTWSTIRNEQGESILEVFYRDRQRWSYTFQNCALLTRYQNIENAISKAREQHGNGTFVFLTERCLETDYFVFTKMLQDEGSINNMEIELYHRLLYQLKKTATSLAAIIHVNTVPALCMERIKQRGRSGEGAISMTYLDQLHKYQSKWIQSATLPTLDTDVTNYEEVERFIAGLAADAAAEPLIPVSSPHSHGSSSP